MSDMFSMPHPVPFWAPLHPIGVHASRRTSGPVRIGRVKGGTPHPSMRSACPQLNSADTDP